MSLVMHVLVIMVTMQNALSNNNEDNLITAIDKLESDVFAKNTAIHSIDVVDETQITNPLTAIMNDGMVDEKEAISVATKECVMSPIGLEAEARRFIKRRHLHLQTERRRQRRDGGYSGPVKYKCRNCHTGF